MTKLVITCSAILAVPKFLKETKNGIKKDHENEHVNIFQGVMVLNGVALVELGNAKVFPADLNEEVTTVQSIQSKNNSFGEIQEVTSKDDSSNERNNQSNTLFLREPPSVTSVTTSLENKLANAADAGHLLRFRITLFATVFGAFLVCLILALGHLTKIPWFYSGIPFSGLLTLLGIMPDDIVFVRAITVFVICLGTYQAATQGLHAYNLWFVDREIIREYEDGIVLDPCGTNLPTAGCLVNTIWYVSFASVTIAAFAYLIPNLSRAKGSTFYDKNQQKGLKFQDSAFRIPCRVALERIWFSGRMFLFLTGSIFFVLGFVQFLLGDRHPWYTKDRFTADLFTGSMFILFAAVFTKSNRMLCTAFLAAITTTADTRNAAGIAALMGSISASDGLAMAKQKFCAIPFDKLKEADFDDNTETEENQNKLYEHTVSVALGKCDAFMSHSWRDDGKKKYEVLSKWSEEFKVKHGRYPLIWLDKACVDQSNIANDLMCLPIFLAGCKTLLIIPGPTYTSRLWCVMEVFVFLHMGGRIQRIKVLPIDMEDDAQMSDIFSSVDVSKSKCCLEEDKQRLLAVVQMGFGSFSSFNETVKGMFHERLSSYRASVDAKRESACRVDSVSDSNIESDRVRD